MDLFWITFCVALSTQQISLGSVEQSLDIEHGPEGMLVRVVLDDEPSELWVTRHSLRTADAVVRINGMPGADGGAPPVPETYRGTVRGHPYSAVVGSLTHTGLRAHVLIGNQRWIIEPADLQDRRVHRVTRAGAAPPLTCGVDATVLPELAPTRSRRVPGDTATGTGCLTLAEIAFDADFEYYQLKGSSIDNVVAAIDAHMNLVDFYYARDIQITFDITAYVVRTTPFYTPVSGGDLLEQFRAEWNANQGAVIRDIAHLMTAKPGAIIEFGGLAWVGVVCTNSGYGWSTDNTNALGHEIGHNWGAGHCHDLAPCNNMCGGCLNIAPNTRDIMEAHRDSRTCLDSIGPYVESLPPYAYPDGLSIYQDKYDALGQPAFDVLGNDDDGNCDPLSIDAHDMQSPRGGTVALSAGTGPEGRDELVYTPPAVPFVGDDVFEYTVGDGTGEQTAGAVTIAVRSLDLAGYWPLNDGRGTAVTDRTVNDRHGAFTGTPIWARGPYDGALQFDGIADAVTIPPLNLHTTELTITAWLQRFGNQDDFCGLVYSRDGNTVAGLHFGTNNELRYSWNDASNTWGWNSGLVVPDTTWVFVALTVEPDRATLFLHDGTMNSTSNVVSHGTEEFDGQVHLASDPGSSVRFFSGLLDEVRIFNHALSAAEIEALALLGGPAEDPLPRNGGHAASPQVKLSWIPGLLAESHNVYFGDTFDAVAIADTASPEFSGTQASTVHVPGPIAPDTTYFWRVDEHALGQIIPGRVWQFSLADFNHWKLDEVSGVTAVDSMGTGNGTYVGNPLLNQPGATPLLGRSASFDGINDAVNIPALDLNSAAVTITAWARRDGPQVPFAGLVFSRAGNSVAGLNLGNANELRYHWNGSSDTWGWDSGLVLPDATWAFAALIVESSRATLCLGQDGTLDCAVNAVNHAFEEFDGTTHIARDPSGNRYFDGRIDDVRIYNAALARQQLAQLYIDSLGCAVLADCADIDADGIRDDNCTWWECDGGACQATAIPFADMGGSNGACPPDQTADGNDRFHALNCFSNTATDGLAQYPCETNPPAALRADAGGAFGACAPDGVCDGNDAFHALNTFSGMGTCTCPD